MKTYLFPALRLTFVLILLFSGVYPLLVLGVAQLLPGGGKGGLVKNKGVVVGYENIGQKFSGDAYFWSRPSAVDYNAAGSGGSNKGPSNPEYLATVQARVDSFLVHNPGITIDQVPADLVTASGSGLDPDISVESAKVQVPRIARIRKINEDRLYQLIDEVKEKPLLGFLGPEKINVLQLNIALEQLPQQ